jgi:hypothetical protein
MFWAQQSESGLSSSASAYQPASTNVPKLIKFSGVVKDLLGKPLTGPVEINFAIYKEQGEGLPIWQETQVLQLDEQGRYSVLLGAMQPEGLPMELFTTGEARWLEVQVAGAEPQPRTLLVSVPYALKAADAESLGGKPASAYLLSQSAEGSAQAGPQTGSKTAPAAAAGKPTTTTAGVNVTPLVAGTGTMNYLAKWTDNSGTLGNAVLFDNGTNVGIGTTAPARALEVYSATSNLGKIRLTETSTTVGAYSGLEFYGRGGVATTFAGGLFREQNTGAVSLWTGNSGSAPKLVILDAGNVGIGTTTPGTLSGGTFGTVGLHVKGNGGSKYIVVDDSNRVGFLMQDSSQAANNRLWGFANQFSRFTIAAYSDAGSPTEYVSVTRSGNVGIGTTAPAAKLDVAGNIHSSGTVTATSFSGSGAGLTGVTASGLAAGTYSNALIFSNASNSFTGSGAGLSGLTAANISSGTASINISGNAANALLLNGLASSAFQPAGSYATLGTNTFTATQNVSSGDVYLSNGNLDLPSTSGSGAGVIKLGGNPFIHAYGTYNAFVGVGAGNFTGGGGYNTAFGPSALHSNTSGTGNTATGYQALAANTTGLFNAASGYQALMSNTTGLANTAVGDNALLYTDGAGNSSYGLNNTAIGNSAGSTNTRGSSNTFVGGGADASSIALTNATAIGANAVVSESNALVLGGTGGNAVSVGIGTATPAYTLDVHGSGNFTGAVTFAGGENITGNVSTSNQLISTVASGTAPLQVTSTTQVANLNASLLGGLSASAFALLGSTNTFNHTQTISSGNLNLPATTSSASGVINLGGYAWIHGYGGNSNTFVGLGAGNFTMTGVGNTAIGSDALEGNTAGSSNTATGYTALAVNNAGADNTATGREALYSNTTGSFNTAIGSMALTVNSTTDNNTATGYNALHANSGGYSNAAFGNSALAANTTGYYNSALGGLALTANTTGYMNTASGYQALKVNTTGLANTAVGINALLNTDGAGNLSYGLSNTAIGNSAGQANTTGYSNTFVGAGADAAVGTLANATAIGHNAKVGVSNALILGGTGSDQVFVGIGTGAPGYRFTMAQGLGNMIADGYSVWSSRRWKTNIQTLEGALSKIERLRGVSYDLKGSGKHEIGVIAEEVGAVVPEVVAWDKNGKDADGVDYSRLTALLIEATKEQQALIRKQQDQIKAQQAQIAQLASQVAIIQASLKARRPTGSAVRVAKAHVSASRSRQSQALGPGTASGK